MRMGGDRQHSERARRSVATFWRMMGASMLLLVILPPLLLALAQKIFNLPDARLIPVLRIWSDFLIPVLIYGVAPLSLVIWVWQRRWPIGLARAGGAPISRQAGKSTTLWVLMAMAGAFVCLAGYFWIGKAGSGIHLTETQHLSTAEVQNLIANPKGRDLGFSLWQYRNSDLRSPDFIAPADLSTLGLLTRHGISYQTRLAGIDWWYRHPSILGTSSAQPHPSISGRPGLSQSTSALGIFVLAAAAGSLLWWMVKSRPISGSRI